MPGSGTGATPPEAAGGWLLPATTPAGNSEALPTVKLDPSSKAWLLVTINVPSETVVPPL